MVSAAWFTVWFKRDHLLICTSSVPHISLAGFKNAVSSRDNDAKCMALKNMLFITLPCCFPRNTMDTGVLRSGKAPPPKKKNCTGKALSLSINARRCAVSLRGARSACLCLTTTWDSFTLDNSHQHQRGKQLTINIFTKAALHWMRSLPSTARPPAAWHQG